MFWQRKEKSIVLFYSNYIDNNHMEGKREKLHPSSASKFCFSLQKKRRGVMTHFRESSIFQSLETCTSRAEKSMNGFMDNKSVMENSHKKSILCSPWAGRDPKATFQNKMTHFSRYCPSTKRQTKYPNWGNMASLTKLVINIVKTKIKLAWMDGFLFTSCKLFIQRQWHFYCLCLFDVARHQQIQKSSQHKQH